MNDTALVRQWRLLKTLTARHYGTTVYELAGEMQVNEKTIRRDLQLFAQVGFPLEKFPGEHGLKRWRLSAGSDRPELNFALDEALALYLGRRFFDPLAGTFLWEAAQSAFRKIRACLGQSALKYLEKMAGSLHHRTVGCGDYSAKAELIDQLLQAIEDRRQAFLVYQSAQATEPVSYPVYPYGMAFYRGSLYLVAYAPDHNELRHYKVDRIETVEVTGLPFNRPEDFDMQRHLAGSFGVYRGSQAVTVKVRFAASVARYVQESHWHDSQRLETQRDGSLLAEFQLSDTEEIKHWLLSFGRHATVLEPATLRKELHDELAATMQHYQLLDSTAVTEFMQA